MTARDEGAGTMGRGEEAREMLSWLDMSIERLRGRQDLTEANLRNKYLRLRALLGAPVSAPGMEREAVATLVMRWRCDMDHGDWPEDKAAALVGYLNDPHHGDCTKHPMTCLRCEAEAAYRMADEIIALQKGSEPADGSQVEPSTTGAGRHIPLEPNPFIQWNGGENPAPGKVVEVRLRRGGDHKSPSHRLRWSHGEPFSLDRITDIIGYRIISPTEPSSAPVVTKT